MKFISIWKNLFFLIIAKNGMTICSTQLDNLYLNIVNLTIFGLSHPPALSTFYYFAKKNLGKMEKRKRKVKIVFSTDTEGQ